MLKIENLKPDEPLIVCGDDSHVPAGTVGLFVSACTNPEWVALKIEGREFHTIVAVKLENVLRYEKRKPKEK